MKASINDNEYVLDTEEKLGVYLDTIDSTDYVEAWMLHEAGESICLLKANKFMFLIYLRYPEDIGFVSKGAVQGNNTIKFKLSNGQVDEHPVRWCIESEQAYKVLAFFYENNGKQSPYIEWQEG